MNLDQLLTLEEAAAMLRLSTGDLLRKSHGKKPIVPAYWLGPKTVRFHPRAIFAKLALEAGMSPKAVELSFAVAVKPVEPLTP